MLPLTGGLSAVALDFGRDSPVVPLLPSASARLLLTGMLFAGSGSMGGMRPLTAKLFHDPRYPNVFMGEAAMKEVGR